MVKTHFFSDAFSALSSLQTALQNSNAETADSLFGTVLDLLAASSSAEALSPYLTDVNDSESLLLRIGHILDTAGLDSLLQEGFTRLCESFLIQHQIRQVLSEDDNPGADEIFADYLDALQLDNPEPSNTEVMSKVWELFESRTGSATVGKLKVLFAEKVVAADFGMDEETLDEVKMILDNDKLYRDVLNILELHQSSNLHWTQVIGMIESAVLRGKPEAWIELQHSLNVWREMLAIDFLEQARSYFESEELYEEFRAVFLAEPELTPEEVFEKIEETGSHEEVEQLVKKLNRLSVYRGTGPTSDSN
ncbi:hypothetical protein HK096_008655 [Nowakowskiella sp. JEL0078]|nr:hypothetical protein HK096_008655 [Nowakowskiella sp. JEL0078]